MLPPLFTHTYVAVTESAVRKTLAGSLPSPAAFPLHVRPVEVDLVQLGVPMKCGLWASAGLAVMTNAASIMGSPRMKRSLLLMLFLRFESLSRPAERRIPR